MDGSSMQQDLAPELAARREAAMASLRRSAQAREAQGYTLMAAAMSMAPAAEGEGLLGKAVHYSKLFLIAFAMLAPNYLVWRLLL